MRDLVVFSLEAWDDVWRRNQYLIDGLLRADPGLRVLFVEPSNDILHSAISRRRMSRGRGLRPASGYAGRLMLFQPDKVLPRVAGPAADALLRRAARRAFRRAGLADPVLWINDPSWAGLVRATGLPSIYDMTDDWLAADRPTRERERIIENERILMAECAEIVVCSTGLERTRSALRPVSVIPNAVDVERYRAAVPKPDDLPGACAVYVGTLHEDRLDVAMLLRTADVLAGVGAEVVLVGPNALGADNTRRLREHGAVRLLGPRPWSGIPAYLQHASVLVVPHVVSGFTDSLDPIKMYEYLAVGRPIVSTPVAGFRDLGPEHVVVVEPEAFPAAVKVAVTAPAPTATVDAVPDWSDRVAAFERLLRPIRAS